MHIGIWCDYGFTLAPTEGIGVFVDNLARGLVRADPDCHILLKAHHGQADVLASTVAGGLGRISVTTGPLMSRWTRRVLRTTNKIRRMLNRPGATRPIAHAIDKWAERTFNKANAPLQLRLREQIESCDVWLLPYVGLSQSFSRPTVVAIHDLVSYHFPEMMSPHKLDDLKRKVEQTAREATLAVCMSKFICQNDLLNTLHLPPGRVRVLASAVPDDLGNELQPANSEPNSAANDTLALGTNAARIDKTASEAESSDAWSELPFPRGTPYLFYPAAFRTYKNHQYLIRALALVREKTRLPMKVVFTGIHHCPAPLVELTAQLKLQEHVVVLKKVSRPVLRQLYRQAFATVVPSLYEQGSFPVMEALNCGCPAVCSNIAALQEQFASMGSSMIYFDPHSPESLVPILQRIEQDRARIIDEQQAGFARMRAFKWEDAARGWLSAFREAIQLGDSIGQMQNRHRAA